MEKKVTGTKQHDRIYELLLPDGIFFWYCHAAGNEVKQIRVENPHPFIHLQFSIRSNSTYRSAKEGNTVARFGNYEYNALYFPAQEAEIEWQPQEYTETFELNIIPELLEKHLPAAHPFLDIIRQQGNGEVVRFNEQNLPLTPQITTILFDILNCPLENHYKRLYLRGKVIELLAILMHQSEQYQTAYAAHGLRQSELMKMQQARQLLHSNLQNPCSLIDLAHQVGTNENYLKKHFKLVFGNTVYGYIHEMRMQQARTMLLQEEKDIRKIATISGYKHVNHFVTAFKKFFGYSPTKLKLGVLSFLQSCLQFSFLVDGEMG